MKVSKLFIITILFLFSLVIYTSSLYSENKRDRMKRVNYVYNMVSKWNKEPFILSPTPQNVPLIKSTEELNLANMDLKWVDIKGLKFDSEWEMYGKVYEWYGENGDIRVHVEVFNSVSDAEKGAFAWLLDIYNGTLQIGFPKGRIGNACWSSGPWSNDDGTVIFFIRKNVLVSVCVFVGERAEESGRTVFKADRGDISVKTAEGIARKIDALLNTQPQIIKVKTTLKNDKETKAGDSFIIDIIANDADQDSLSYTYTLDNKSFSSTSNKQTFTAPSSKGKYNLHIKVEDGHGGVAEKNIEIEVK